MLIGLPMPWLESSIDSARRIYDAELTSNCRAADLEAGAVAIPSFFGAPLEAHLRSMHGAFPEDGIPFLTSHFLCIHISPHNSLFILKAQHHSFHVFCASDFSFFPSSSNSNSSSSLEADFKGTFSKRGGTYLMLPYSIGTGTRQTMILGESWF